jgi:hypothetical protein
MRAHGVTLEIRQIEFGAFLAEARANPKRFDALFTGIPGDLSLSYLAAMFDSRLSGGPLDYAGFHTPALDSAVRSAVRGANAAPISWRRGTRCQRVLGRRTLSPGCITPRRAGRTRATRRRAHGPSWRDADAGALDTHRTRREP